MNSQTINPEQTPPVNSEHVSAGPEVSPSKHADSSDAWKKIEAAFAAEFHEPDMGAVRAVYSAVAAHYLPGPPVWMFDIAPPSSGKTEKLMPLSSAVGALIISSVTPQTFLSGKIAGDGSLLTKIGKSGVIVIKDFSQVLSMPKKTKGPILADFRDIYDGHIAKEFGTGERKEWCGRITLIAGVTPDIDLHYSIFQTLGERFVQVRSRRPGGVEAALRAFEQQPTKMHDRLNEAVTALFHPIVSGPISVPFLPTKAQREIANLAEFVVHARTHVPRAGNSHDILYAPEAEASPRLAQQLAQLAKGSALLDGRTCVNEIDMALVKRVAFDSMPAVRRSILDYLAHDEGAISQAELAKGLRWTEAFTRRRVEDLEIFGLIERKEQDDNVDPDLRTVSISLSAYASDLLAGCNRSARGEISVPESPVHGANEMSSQNKQ